MKITAARPMHYKRDLRLGAIDHIGVGTGARSSHVAEGPLLQS